MITVSSDFKNAMKADAKQMAAFLTDGTDPIYGTTDLQTLRIEQKGSLCKTVMRYAKAQFLGSHDYLDKTVSLGIGVVLPNATTEYITYGNFLVKKQTKSEDTEETIIEMYDLMYESLKKYALTPTYPLTLIGFVQLICTELGWTFDEASFPNSTQTISSELFSDLDVSYRDILDMVAEASGCIIYFGVDNKLHFKQISGTVLETLTLSEQMTLDVESEYGELNSVVLSRSPQEDNIAQQDAESIATYGLNEFKIVNNVIVDSDRETWITAIFNALNGIKYFPTEVKTVGLGYFEVGDRIEVTDVDTTEKEMIISSIEMVVDGGFSEIIRAEIPTKSVTEYSWAGIIGKQIKNVQIIVNKQAGEIQLLNEAMETVLTVPQQSTPPESPETGDLYLDTDDNIIYRYNGTDWVATGLTLDDLEDYYTKDETIAQITIQADQITQSVESVQTTANNAQALAEENADGISSVQSQVTSLNQTAEDLTLSVQKVGGTNLLKNSAGKKPLSDEWIIPVNELQAEVLQDFAGVTLPSDWTAWVGDSAFVAVNGYLQLNAQAGGWNDVGVYRNERLPFKNKAISCKIYDITLPNGYSNLEVTFLGGYSMNIGMKGDTLTSGANKGAGWFTVGYTTRTTEEFVRIRWVNNVAYFEASDDGIDWTVFAQTDFDVELSDALLNLWVWDTAAGSAKFDDVKYWRFADPGNDGTTDQSSDTIQNTESGSAIVLDESYIQQTVPTIQGEEYTFYCRFKKEGSLYLYVSGLEAYEEITVDDYVDGTWAIYRYQFTAPSNSVDLMIDCTTADSSCFISDIVLKLGEVGGWTQAPNEVYGTNFQFDKDGFSITSETSPFKSVLDNTRLAVFDTSSGSNRVIMLVSKDSGMITNLVVQDELVLHRYENSASATRFISTSTGCMITVND